MLKQLRNKKTAKKLWIGLAVIIIPAFVFWGFSGALRGPRESGNIGRIYGKKVSSLEFRDALEAVKNQAIMQFGDNFSEIQRYLNLESQAWTRLLLLHEAGRRKIKISNREVIEAVESNPIFQGKGKFDNKIYAELLQYVFRTQPRVFEEQTRQSLIISKLYERVTGGVSLNDQEVKEEYRKANEELSIYYIAALISDFEKEIKPSEKDLLGFFAKNSLQFKQPLSFNMDYIVLESEDAAKNAAAIAAKFKDLNKTAAELKLTVKETGLFGQTDAIPGIGWSPEILMLVSKLKTGQISPPIKVDKRYYILKLRERKDPYIPEYASIKVRLNRAFVQAEAKRLAKQKTDDCLKKLKAAYEKNPKSADFNKLAKACGLKSDSTGLFKFGSYIENIGSSDEFWKAAEDLKKGESSGVITMPSGFYIIKLKEKIPVDEKKFTEEKEAFSLRLLEQKKQEYFNKFLEELSRKSGFPRR